MGVNPVVTNIFKFTTNRSEITGITEHGQQLIEHIVLTEGSMVEDVEVIVDLVSWRLGFNIPANNSPARQKWEKTLAPDFLRVTILLRLEFGPDGWQKKLKDSSK